MAPPIDRTDNPRLFGLRRSALLEMALFFGTFLLLDLLFLDGTRLRDVSPHPFWIAIVLIAAQYGINEGLVVAVLSSAVLLIGNLPPQDISQDMYGYLFAVCLNPLLWLPAALVLGSLRSRQISEVDHLCKSLQRSREESDALAKAYQRLSVITSKLEPRLAGKFCTVFTVFQAMKLIARNDESRVLDGVKEAMDQVLGPHRFSVFLVQPNGMQAAVQVGWEDERPLQRWFGPMTPLYQQVIFEGHQLCVADPRDEAVLGDQGLLAGPINDPATGKPLGMLKIEGLKFLDLNEDTLDVFRVLCDWIGIALARARAYERAVVERFQTRNPRLLSDAALDHQIHYFEALADRFGLDLSMIVVNPLRMHSLVSEERSLLVDIFNKAVQESLRGTDVVFECRQRGPHFVIILVGASVELGEAVSRKLSETFNRMLPVNLRDLEIKYHVKAVKSEHG